MSHYGEEVVEGYTMSNRRMDTVCYQKDGKWIQKFGYPVYISGLQYAFRINAREEYRYNNDRNNAPDLVPLGNHTYAIYNGLKSGTSIIRGGLDNLGTADVVLDVENMSFDGVEEQVLKHFDVSVEINGQDVHAEPMRAFVTGSRITGADAMQDIGAKITVEDVLRDPPGTSSYAWLEKGVTYTTSYNIADALNIGMDFSYTDKKSVNQSVGTFAGQGAGTYNGTFMENESGKTRPLGAYTQGFSWNRNYTYSYTTSERIQTSSEANIMGADATLFIGHTINAYAMNAETFNVVDSATLKMMQPAIKQGVAHVVAKDTITGSALVVTQDLAFTLDKEPVRFVYTQAHIVKQIIPQLAAQMASLLRTGTDAEMQALANATQDYVYWYKQDYNPQVDTVPYTLVKPNPLPTNKPLVNKMMGYNSLIRQWIDILRTNEYCELYGTMPQNRVVSYSLSDNTSVTHTETGSAGYNYSMEISEKPTLDAFTNLTDAIFGEWTESKKEIELIKEVIKNMSKQVQDTAGTITVANPVQAWKFNWKTSLGYVHGDTKGRNRSANRTIGFTLSQAEYGYIDVDVYRLTGTVDFNNDSTMTSWRNQAINTITRKDMDTSGYECSDFIYLLRGGATRCMWIPERKTEFYRPGTLLDPPTLKLDEAHLEVNQHEVSGVAADGVAVFDLQIWNESEAAPGVANGPHNFILKLLEGSNPNGAKATIDGLPLTGTGRNFYLEPGQIIHKKMEIRQGAVALNYDSLKLCLMSDCDTSNYANQYISVHFLPASSPVRIATPDDKWVMNTNSPYDKQGYYLPVVIDGFDPDYAEFDHIELQYKLSTQSENNWVTLCSYYKKEDSVYYNKASGNKQYFNKEAGRIDNIHFYGERDPMEQRYDLRAVSYCRYGTGYVTKASEPVSGIKDTRRPELFGKVTPANGVLTQQDYISVPFSEPIAYNYLDEDNNFQVIGFKNKADYYNTPTLLFGGNGYATTKTSHNLTQSDFTIDLTVLQDAGTEPMTYFSTGENVSGNEKGVEFGWTGSSLYAKIGNQIILSEQKEMPKAFTRMILTYDKAKKEVGFYLGGQPLQAQVGEASSDNCTAPFIFGADKNLKNPFRGRMIETRIWTKALTMEEVQSSSGTGLTGYEKGLLAYYPMNEGYGTIAYDKAHGANADLHNLTWSMPQGLAIRTSGEGVQLDPKWFNNSADADYTLILNFKSNPSSSFNGDALLFGDKDAKRDTTNRQVGIFMTQTGQIEIAFGSTKRLTADGNYNNGAWHSLGLVVSRSFNYTHLYIDDKLKAQADGQFFGVWAMSQTILGRNFNGYFDELSIWELAMPQSYLSEFTTYAPNGQEMGLRCYLPFDQRIKNASSIYETHYSRYNARLYYNSDNREWYAKQDTVVVSNLDDKSTTKDVCPLIRESEYEKMRFSWTSRDNDLVINLKMPDAEINHKSIFFSLRDVEDLQGNRLLNPIAWSVYLDRNIIRWAEQNLWVEKSASPVDTVVYTTITNYSGETKPFVISGLPDWLTVDEPIGMLQPQEERVLAFTISGDLNAGDYVVPIALTDEADLSDQMLINVRVNAVFPNWSIPNSFNLNMNLIGTVHLRDGAHSTYVDTDTRDVVGAFYGNTCVGMQSITSKVGSTANLYLKVYGKADMDKKDISLRLWQASTGKTFELTNSSDPTNQSEWRIRFVSDTVYGSVQKPIDFYVADSRVQNIPIYTGWNWISFNVQPTDINSSFINVGGFSSNDQIKVYRDERVASSDDAAVYTQGRWSNNIMLDYRNIYMMNVSSSMVLEVRGLATGQAPELTFRHGWNNLPCLFDANTPVDAAMADYFNAAKDGDIITGYYQFAVFDNKQWVGSLESLIPGEGYMLYRQATDNVTVHFYPSAPASAPRKKVESERGSESRTYSTAMPIVAALESNEVAINLDNAVLRAYAHDELVGEAKAVDGMWFLLVHAKDNAELTFTVTDDKGEEHSASNVLNYGAFAPTGTVHNPYLIRFGESDLRKVMEHGILYIHRNGNTYNAQGGKL
ncbi:MAG: LamG domain-containing protein [Paludibacteraceae bacterium]|nr:LamG domain-containing protein [Paludibacteraceae bacterium]